MDSTDQETQVGKLSHLLRILTSVPVMTLALMLLLELTLRQVDIPDALGFRSADMGLLAERLDEARKKCADVAMVGSSQILVLNRTEGGKDFYSGHPNYFQKKLSEETKEPVFVLNLGTDGQMVSEAYLISEAVTSNKCHPPVLIYGIALREFITDALALEWSTENFNCVAPYVPLNGTVLGNMYSFDAMRELTLAHYCYIYRDRLGFKCMLLALTKNMLEFLPLDDSFERVAPPDLAMHPQRNGFLIEQWVPRKLDVETSYRTHPEVFNAFFYALQKGVYEGGHDLCQKISGKYFPDLLDMCQKKNIKLVIVNMPLSQTIMKLPEPGSYEAFQAFLKEGADHKLFTLIDLYNDPQFRDDADFRDGVHLKYDKAKELADRIISELKSKAPDVLEAIKEHAAAHEQNSSYTK